MHEINKLNDLKTEFEIGEFDKNLAYTEGVIDGKVFEKVSISGQRDIANTVKKTPYTEQQLKTSPTKEDIIKGQKNVDRRAYDSEDIHKKKIRL